MMKLKAILASVLILTGTGFAHADSVTKNAAAPLGAVLLTDTQLDRVASGHLYGPAYNYKHYGKYWVKKKIKGKWFYVKASGYHYGCGAKKCKYGKALY